MKNMTKSKKIFPLIVFVLCFAASLFVSLTLFFSDQTRNVADYLKKDFTFIIVCDGGLDRDAKETLRQNLLAVAGTDTVKPKSGDERLKELKAEDYDMVSSVLTLGENPLPDTFEVTLKDEAVGSINKWLENIKTVDGVDDVIYKSLEAYALMHFMFYTRVAHLVLSFAAIILFLLLVYIFAKVSSGVKDGFENAVACYRESFAGAFGSFMACMIVYVFVFPVKNLSSFWSWPSVWANLGIVFCGAVAGLIMALWKKRL